MSRQADQTVAGAKARSSVQEVCRTSTLFSFRSIPLIFFLLFGRLLVTHLVSAFSPEARGGRSGGLSAAVTVSDKFSVFLKVSLKSPISVISPDGALQARASYRKPFCGNST